MNPHNRWLWVAAAVLASLAGCGDEKKEDAGGGGTGGRPACAPGEFGNVCDPVVPIGGSGGSGGTGGTAGSGAGGKGGSGGGASGSGGGASVPARSSSGWRSTGTPPSVPDPPPCEMPAPDSCPENVLAGDADVRDQATADALQGVTHIEGDLTIEGDATNLDALRCLLAVDGVLEITYNRDLTSLDGLRSLQRVGAWVDIADNDQADTGCGLYNLTDIGEHSITPQLDIASSGFRALRLPKLKRTGQLRVEDCPQLAVFEGPDELAEIGQFFVRDNPMLKQLSGFSGLTSVGDIRIEDNPALPVCDALLIVDRLVKNGGFTGVAALGGNLEVCP